MRIHYKCDPSEIRLPMNERSIWRAFDGKSEIGSMYTEELSGFLHSDFVWNAKLFKGFSTLNYPTVITENMEPYIEKDYDPTHDYNLVLINPRPMRLEQAKQWIIDTYKRNLLVKGK